MFQIAIIPLILSLLPIEDGNIKMHIGFVLGEIVSRGYFNKLFARIYNYFQKRQIIIPAQTVDMNSNPLFYKVQDYLAFKFAASIESCELVPKNGDVEFSLSDMSGKIFTDTKELGNATHTFELSIEKSSDNSFDANARAMKQIVIKSTTASPY